MTRLWAWTSALLLLVAPIAVADDEGDDDDDRHEGRKLQLDVDDLKATIKLERELGASEDAVKIEFEAQKAKLQVKHEEKNETSESEQKLEARFLALVEFVDADGDGAYDVGERLASAWALGEGERDAKFATNGTVRWGDIAVSDVVSGNTSGKKLSSRASFGPNATFGLDFFVYGDLAVAGATTLLPTEAKIDIIIERYPYVAPDSALAVVVDLKAKEEFEDGRESDEEDGLASTVDTGNLTFRLAFTWLENATVDGVDRDVRSTVIKNKAESEDGGVEQKARVALAYPRGDVIVHDPTVGVQYETQGSDARAVPAAAGALVLAAVASAAFAFGRRQR